MTGAVRTAASLLLLWVLAAGPGCNQGSTMTLNIVTPVGDDPFASATRVRLVTGPLSQVSAVTASHFSVSVDLSPQTGLMAPIVLDALAADGSIVGHGITPIIPILITNASYWIYVARPGSLTVPANNDGTPIVLSPPRSRHAAVYYRGFGVFIAGGRGPDGKAIGAISLWDEYQLAESTNADLALNLPRTDLSAGTDPNGFVYWVGGADTGGSPTSIGELMDPTERLIPPPWERVRQGPGEAILTRTSATAAQNSEGLLLFGGLGADHKPQAGAVLFSAATGSELVGWAGAQARVGATSTQIAGGAQILLFGGGAPGAPVMERYTKKTMVEIITPDPTTNRSGHSAVQLLDSQSRLLFVGGTDDMGHVLASATVFEPVFKVTMELPTFLHHARTGHTATIANNEVVIIGGRDQNGMPVGTAEVFDARSLAFLREVPMNVPRSYHTASATGNGSVVVLGGEDATGAPVGKIEIYTPGL